MSHPVPPSASASDPGKPRNLLLRLLPQPERDILLAKCSPVELKSNQLIYAVGDPLQYSYFIHSGMAATMAVMDDGGSAEVSCAGHEGLVGIAGVMGIELSPYRSVMLVGGQAWKVPAEELRRVADRSRAIEEMLRRYMLLCLVQGYQTAACNALHNLTRRLSRRLLKAADQLNSNMLPLTHEFLADALGTQRSSVSLAAEKLERRGIIAYKRGRIRILDRQALERCSCECYATVRSSLKEILMCPGTEQPGNSPSSSRFGVPGRSSVA